MMSMPTALINLINLRTLDAARDARTVMFSNNSCNVVASMALSDKSHGNIIAPPPVVVVVGGLFEFSLSLSMPTLLAQEDVDDDDDRCCAAANLMP